MRFVVLAVAVVFTAAFLVLTALDISRNGFTVLDAPAIVIVILFAVGVIGALLEPPKR
ncbi:MAG: hypothetical protein WAK93_17380 [Solirubrobacteraceae bacterium]